MRRGRTQGRLLRAMGCAAVAMGLGACGAPAPSGPQGAVLVVLDTLRADRTSLLGYERPTTPGLERLAGRGVVFEQAVSTSARTLPAMVGLLSGRFPARDVFPEGRLARSLVEKLAAAGFTTAAITESGYVSKSFGLDLGFGFFHEELPPGIPRSDRRPTYGPASVAHTFDKAIRWLRAHRDERFFLLIHTYEPHTPYRRRRFVGSLSPGRLGPTFEVGDAVRIYRGQRIDEAERAYLGALYDGGVWTADQQVARLAGALEELALAERTLLVVTSDHGEDLGGRFPNRVGCHGHSLYDELLRVPLVVIDPTRRFAVERVAAQVRTLDVLPTILDLLGVPIPEDLDGHSLRPLMEGEEREDRPAPAAVAHQGPVRVAIRVGRSKLIENLTPERSEPPIQPDAPRHELYDLRSDPDERRNLADQRPELRERLAAELAAWQRRLQERGGATVREPDSLDDETRRQLEALGYVESEADAAAPGSDAAPSR